VDEPVVRPDNGAVAVQLEDVACALLATDVPTRFIFWRMALSADSLAKRLRPRVPHRMGLATKLAFALLASGSLTLRVRRATRDGNAHHRDARALRVVMR
jgi:hypothetical protein